MSASDAAPLPRLGEVFFDVRGNSRTMRLSWYADTGIAVFSIWQGGRCTGTFRLPMDDLARMTEILQRGPQRRHLGGRHDYEPASPDEAGYDGGQHRADWYDDQGHQSRSHGPEEPGATAAYPDWPGANRPSAGRDSGFYAGSAGYGDSGGYERSGGYADSGGYERSGGYADSGGYGRSGNYSDSAAAASDATGRFEFPARAVSPADAGYLPAATDRDRGAVSDVGGYGHQRFVPPYVGAGGESGANDNPAAGSARRRSAADPAYLADRGRDPADPGRYAPAPDPEAGYPGGSAYRLAADPAAAGPYPVGRHSGQPAGSPVTSSFAEPELGAPDQPASERDYWRRQAR